MGPPAADDDHVARDLGAWGRILALLTAVAVISGVVLALVLPRSGDVGAATDRPPVAVASDPPAQPSSPTPPAAPAPSDPATGPTQPTPAGHPPPATTAPAPTFTYAFPIDPPSAASYGRDHHDYPATDLFAPCGTPVVAPTTGVVQEMTTVDRWDPAVDDPDTRGGLSIAIVGDDGVRHYMSHLEAFEPTVQVGTPLVAGQRIATVGRTGNAAPTPCHVHYGLTPPRGPGDTLVRRGVIWPWPYLDDWAAGATDRSPREEVLRWAEANP